MAEKKGFISRFFSDSGSTKPAAKPAEELPLNIAVHDLGVSSDIPEVARLKVVRTPDRVLLVEQDGGEVVAGQPYVAGASVTGVVEAQTMAKKIRVFRMKRRKHFRRTMGHRTQLTRVRVTGINL